MKKLLVIIIAALSVLIVLASCSSYDLCPTYSHTSFKSYGGSKYVHHTSAKKAKKNKVW